ncbi:restriction endonuclease [Actinomadura graeca]|uniref:Restriction endonuclease n=1 Tax=Actinomadura graeca TaxID=2750812 RepID=A0ABX8R0D7_9ACTN|nr:NaeI family type II restriction endonuclease [Actinomadura graeca]QXJ22493.1 restriction endonuclease [Actinomadura graeca]
MPTSEDQPPLFGSSGSHDRELELVRAHLLALDPDGSRFAAAIRRSLDMLLDGPHTGRYDWDQLYKTEKTHCGTVVEINLQREFKFDGGQTLDYSIVGYDVDCKYSQTFGGWQIPPEAVGKLLLVVWANDRKGLWSAGLIRARKEWLNTGNNRDRKITLKAVHRNNVRWLFKDAPLAENALLRLPERDLDAIFAKRSGQQRVNELLSRATGIRLTRIAIWTVATANDKPKDDPTRRIRGGRQGARGQLRPKGVVIFGDYESHREAARALGLPVPGDGEYVSIRLARRRLRHGDAPHITLDGEDWVVAGPEDPVEAAPALPEIKKATG